MLQQVEYMLDSVENTTATCPKAKQAVHDVVSDFNKNWNNIVSEFQTRSVIAPKTKKKKLADSYEIGLQTFKVILFILFIHFTYFIY